MLLNMSEGEILHMLRDREALDTKVGDHITSHHFISHHIVDGEAGVVHGIITSSMARPVLCMASDIVAWVHLRGQSFHFSCGGS